MKKLNSLLIYCLIALFTLSGCYEHETIESERGKLFEIVKDSDDPLDHYIYEFYTKYGTIIKYDYENIEWKWDWNRLLRWSVKIPTDRDAIFDAIKTFEEKFVNIYPEEFLKKFLPRKIFLANTLYISWPESDVGSAYVHIILGSVKDDFPTWDDAKKTKWASKIHQEYWSEWMVRLGYLEVPESFYKISEAYYEKNWGKGYDDATNMFEMGFWTDRRGYESPKSPWVWPPLQKDDWKKFLTVIMANTKEQLDEKMEGYPLLQKKAKIVVKYFKETYGLDIQKLSE